METVTQKQFKYEVISTVNDTPIFALFTRTHTARTLQFFGHSFTLNLPTQWKRFTRTSTMGHNAYGDQVYDAYMSLTEVYQVVNHLQLDPINDNQSSNDVPTLHGVIDYDHLYTPFIVDTDDEGNQFDEIMLGDSE